MNTVMVILFFGLVVLLILITAIEPRTSGASLFEKKRRKTQQTAASIDTGRDAHYHEIVFLRRIVQAICLVVITMLAVQLYGWFFGGATSIVIALFYGAIARQSKIRFLAARVYTKFEAKLLQFVAEYEDHLSWIRWHTPGDKNIQVGSREELEHVVRSAGEVISSNEKSRLLSVMSFPDKIVSEIMTPKAAIDTIRRSELLGPLTLDELHKTGHSRFPVIDGDIDHVVGMLYLRDILHIDSSKKHTAKVESAMNKQVFFIHQQQTLEQALAAFLSSHHHLFIVINEFRETVGVLSLEDVIEALLGKHIVDEYDTHSDLRTVANRLAKFNNSSLTSEDV